MLCGSIRELKSSSPFLSLKRQRDKGPRAILSITRGTKLHVTNPPTLWSHKIDVANWDVQFGGPTCPFLTACMSFCGRVCVSVLMWYKYQASVPLAIVFAQEKTASWVVYPGNSPEYLTISLTMSCVAF